MGEIQQDGLPLPRRNWAMAVIALGMTMAVLDGAIANVALPTIAGDLHVNPSSSIWVVPSLYWLFPLWVIFGDISGCMCWA